MISGRTEFSGDSEYLHTKYITMLRYGNVYSFYSVSMYRISIDIIARVGKCAGREIYARNWFAILCEKIQKIVHGYGTYIRHRRVNVTKNYRLG